MNTDEKYPGGHVQKTRQRAIYNIIRIRIKIRIGRMLKISAGKNMDGSFDNLI